MTHLYRVGCPAPHRAFTVCGLEVDTIKIVGEMPSCAVCADEDARRERMETAQIDAFRESEAA